MSYNFYEASTYLGRPSHLYEFSIEQKTWYSTSADSDISFNGNLYKAEGISDNGVSQTGEVQTDNFTMQIPSTHDIVALYVNTPPVSDLTVRRRRKHENDDEAPVNYVGYIVGVNFTNPGVVEITCQTLSPRMQRNGLRITYQRGCPYALYDGATCKVNKALYALVTTASSIDAGAVTVAADLSAFGDDYFTAGFIEWTDVRTGGPNRRAITKHTGNTITLMGRADGISQGDAITLYPGCDRVIGTCSAKFNNLDNYGGFTNLPGKSPFSGDPIY